MKSIYYVGPQPDRLDIHESCQEYTACPCGCGYGFCGYFQDFVEGEETNKGCEAYVYDRKSNERE